MSIESDFFRKTTFDPQLLRKEGVREDSQGFHVGALVMEGRFHAELVIHPDGTATGRLIECALDDEYLPLRAVGQKGAFVSRVRMAYLEFLKQVADRYGITRYFVSGQLNRISDWVFEAFGERPDFPFKNVGNNAVFRNHENRKWYLLAVLPKGEECELVDVKVDRNLAPAMVAMPGFLPAYHMNKQNWISIRMDGTVDDELVKDLVRESRALTCETIERKDVCWKWRRRMKEPACLAPKGIRG